MLLSIITRCSSRPNLIKRCKQSVIDQDSKNFEHLLIYDTKQSGLLYANRLIVKAAKYIKGKFVFILDDDEYFICTGFVSGFAKFLFDCSITPDVVFVKSLIDGKEFPKNWLDIRNVVSRKEIDSSNYIVSEKLFKKHVTKWAQPRAGDFFFIDSVIKNDPKPWISWWDKVAVSSKPSFGMSEAQLKENYGLRYHHPMGERRQSGSGL